MSIKLEPRDAFDTYVKNNLDDEAVSFEQLRRLERIIDRVEIETINKSGLTDSQKAAAVLLKLVRRNEQCEGFFPNAETLKDVFENIRLRTSDEDIGNLAENRLANPFQDWPSLHIICNNESTIQLSPEKRAKPGSHLINRIGPGCVDIRFAHNWPLDAIEKVIEQSTRMRDELNNPISKRYSQVDIAGALNDVTDAFIELREAIKRVEDDPLRELEDVIQSTSEETLAMSQSVLDEMSSLLTNDDARQKQTAHVVVPESADDLVQDVEKALANIDDTELAQVIQTLDRLSEIDVPGLSAYLAETAGISQPIFFPAAILSRNRCVLGSGQFQG